MLTIKEIEAAKPGKHGDGNGLFLLVSANGSRYWRLKYRIAGKEKLLAIGVYPAVRPPEARIKAQKARDLIRDGIDPSAERKASKEALKQAGANNGREGATRYLAQIL